MIDFIELAISWLKSFKMEYVINDADYHRVSYTLFYKVLRSITVEEFVNATRITIQYNGTNDIKTLLKDDNLFIDTQNNPIQRLIDEINKYFIKNPELHKKFLKDKKLFSFKREIKEKKQELKQIKKDIRRLKEELKKKKQELKVELAEIKENCYDR